MNTGTNIINRKGVSVLQTKIEEELEWIFREQPTSDYGIDAQIEIIENNMATGRLIAVQLKSGDSFFEKMNADKSAYVFYGDREHLEYWLNHSLPVILVLCDVNKKVCYWQQITREHIELTKKQWKTEVPISNIISPNRKIFLQKISDNKSEYERLLIKLALAKPWMEELKKGNTIILESKEWINKCNGIGSFEIILNDSVTMWESNVMLPFTSYEDAFEKIFPWADINVDQDFYNDYDEQNFFEQCPYDPEEEEVIYEPEDLENYIESLPKIRPYVIESGELAKYRFILTINEIGKAFLTIDNYVSKENRL